MLQFFKRANAETTVSLQVDRLRALLNENCGPVSSDVWRDRFVIGYVAGALHALLKVHNPPGTNPDYAVLQSGRLWQRLTGLPGDRFGRDSGVLTDNRDEDFMRGLDRGVFWAAIVTGRAERDDPELVALLEIAKKTSASYERVHGEPAHHMAQAASLVLAADFFKRVAMLNQFSS